METITENETEANPIAEIEATVRVAAEDFELASLATDPKIAAGHRYKALHAVAEAYKILKRTVAQ